MAAKSGKSKKAKPAKAVKAAKAAKAAKVAKPKAKKPVVKAAPKKSAAGKPTAAKAKPAKSALKKPAPAKKSATAKKSPAVKKPAKVTPTSAPESPSTSPAEILGHVAWLMTRSAGHHHLFLVDLEWLVLPPLMHRQFRLVRNGTRPFAYAAWAFLNEEAERRLLSGQFRLRPDDWRSGDRAWIIDLVTPFGEAATILKHLKKQVFANQSLKLLRRRADGKGMEGVEVAVKPRSA